MTEANDRAMFGRLIREAKVKSGLTWNALADSIGTSNTHLKRLASGGCLASPEMAAHLADHFGNPVLVDIMARLRTRTCVRCGVTFRTQAHSQQRIYCTEACQNRGQYQKRIGDREFVLRGTRSELHDTKAVAAAQSAAIAAFCASCEPEGHCRMASCELRDVSPLPLSRRATA
jgi:transcriptional regulator with XRE-family HTH domain